MKKLLAVVALAAGLAWGLGSESQAVSGWTTFGSGMAVARRSPSDWGPHAEINVSSTTRANPEALRIVLNGPQPTGPESGYAGWHLTCWKPGGVHVERDGEIRATELPATVNLSSRVPGGVQAWKSCDLSFFGGMNIPGRGTVLLQARYP
jgi:hypothetical protein